MNPLQSQTPDWQALARIAREKALLVRFGETDESVAALASGLVYLATPYSKVTLDDRGNWSFHASADAMERASRVSARLAKLGITAVSPIVMAADMCHTDATLDPLDADFWTRWCAPILAASRSVVVPSIPGWDQSVGIWHEVREAIGRNRTVHVYAGVSV
ncbi:DUF1937 family protein [Defluviimonas aestuarii]|uniref:DUF1937 family protein n=1 Tax=Albidovulum aestuarii TaxID=1130726 RepID=UPI00249C3E00|nr:DUF1937 family protein [Defluviimonas aestuarii]MDI3335885.1 DUF1937 family protein [Defluviimonas aestuarii]